MTDAKIDDFTGKTYNPEDEQTYTIEVKTKKPTKNEEGETFMRTERLFFEVTFDSFKKLILDQFQGRKVVERWQHFEGPSEEYKKKYPNARGKWVKSKV